jgi:hypothetical protein
MPFSYEKALAQTLSPAELRTLFVARATEKFAANVPDFVALRKLVVDHGGMFRNDHGAIRTADAQLCALFVRAARALGLRRESNYRFPAKKLISFDLQVIGERADEFKIFVSQIDLDAFPPAVAALIRDDCREQAAAADHTSFLEWTTQAERDGGLPADVADRFVEHFVQRVMARSGRPLLRTTLDAVAAISGEAASALALGPDFNHVTIDVRAAGFSGIEEMTDTLRAHGFRMLPQIQGAPRSPLRQTATLAASMPTPVRETDGSLGTAATERQFIEIIERNQQRDIDGAPLWTQDGRPLIFRGFVTANAEKIFGAASTKPSM